MSKEPIELVWQQGQLISRFVKICLKNTKCKTTDWNDKTSFFTSLENTLFQKDLI